MTGRVARTAVGIFGAWAILFGAPTVVAADPTFGVMNASGGIYWRSGPDWNTAEATAGNGFYPGTVIAVRCYQSGAANVPGSSDNMWEQASWVSGPGTGSGWVNEHFINDGSAINQPSPGASPCPAAGTGPGGGPGGASGSGGSTPSSVAMYYSPYGPGSFELSDKSVHTLYASSFETGCENTLPAYEAAIRSASGAPISTLAGWSAGRLGVFKFLAAATMSQLQALNYVLLIDPGQYGHGQMSCDVTLGAGSELVDWLLANRSAHLVVISTTEVSQQQNSKGIQEIYYNPIRYWSTPQHDLRKRVLTCNYTMSHRVAFYSGKYWIAHQIGSTTKSCPWLSYAGKTHHPSAGWHP